MTMMRMMRQHLNRKRWCFIGAFLNRTSNFAVVNTTAKHLSNRSLTAQHVLYSSAVLQIPQPSNHIRWVSNGSMQNVSAWDIVSVLNDAKATSEHKSELLKQWSALVHLEKDSIALEVIQSDILDLLMKLIEANDPEFMFSAYVSLIKLSPNQMIAQELVRLNTVDLLASHLRNKNARLQAAGCILLGSLALDTQGGKHVAKSQVVKNLMELLESPHDAIQRAAAGCLGNIAGNPQGKDILLDSSDFVTELSNILSSDKSEQLKASVALTLGNMLSERDVTAQDVLRECGGLAELVYLLSPAFSEETNCHAAWAIHHGVYHNQDSQSLVGEAGGLSMLLSHISSNMESLRTNALLALSSTISAHVKNKQKLLGDKEAMHLLETLTEQYEEGEENVTPHKTLKKILQEFK